MSKRITLRTAALAGLLPFLWPTSAPAAETVACAAVTEPALAEGIALLRERLRREWRESGRGWATHYRFEAEKANPFDTGRLAELKPGTGKIASGTSAKAPPPAPIEGYASAFDVRCETANEGQDARVVKVVFTAARLRFKEGGGAWSPTIRNAPIASFILTRAEAGWAVVDRTAEDGALPPDAHRSLPAEHVAQQLFEEPWKSQAVRGKGKSRAK